MESFFFNITERRYKVTELLQRAKEYIKQVDISNGIVFLDVYLKSTQEFKLKNLDRMVMFNVVERGSLTMYDKIKDKKISFESGKVSILCSSRQDITFSMAPDSKIFTLFIADFFLKRYLSSKPNEPIDYLYNKIQEEVSLELVNTQALDALSLYTIDKIIHTNELTTLTSLKCEHNVIEFMLHRLSLCDMISQDIDEQEQEIARRAKDKLLRAFSNPPTIHELAHICATNESKLKKVFKKVYKSTIHNYVQKLRLEEANILFKEQSLTIGEISKKVGYSHQGHFSKLFFTTYGIYPKDLLKSR